MIGVIADDLTGAAELGGVGLRFGLQSEIHTNSGFRSAADLIALDSDSRSCLRGESIERVLSGIGHLKALGASLIYKKVDSALRGRIVAEVDALMKASKRKRAMLIPANPSLNRVIRDGCYYINGIPIDQTGFKSDPEYPCRSSSVLEILGTDELNAPVVCRLDEPMPEEGIIVGEACTRTDLLAWAARLDETILPAGAAEFFTAILETRGFQPIPFRPSGDVRPPDGPDIGFRSVKRNVPLCELFVCGSASDATERFLKDMRAQGIAVLSMPLKLTESCFQIDGLKKQWLEDTVKALSAKQRAIVAIDHPVIPDPKIAEQLLEHLINHVEGVLAAAAIDCVFVEGGATAAQLMRRMNWSRLNVVREFSQGVVSLLPHGHSRPVVTMKPGSYVWAPEIFGKSGQT